MSQELFRFLLIDDEEIIRTGISSNIDWESEGFQFLEPAYDGFSAIEAIDRFCPDVILTDICMPGKDGIEIAEYAFRKYPETLIVMLSGHDDFEYARSALRFNVFDYIVKPISARTLKKFLERIREELNKRNSNKLNYERLLAQVEKSRECILSRFLYKLTKRGGVEASQMETLRSQLPFNESFTHFCVTTLIISKAQYHPKSSLTPDMCLIALSEAADRLTPEGSAEINFQTPDGELVIILGHSSERMCRISTVELAEALHKESGAIPGYVISAGVGTVQNGLLDVGTSYNESISALGYRLIAGCDEVFIFRKRHENIVEYDIQFKNFPNRMKELLRSQPLEESVNLIRSFCNSLKNSRFSLPRIRFELTKFIFAIIEVLDDIDIIDDIDNLTSIIDLPEIPEIEAALISTVTSVSGRLKEQRKTFPEQKVYEIQKYLEAEFQDPEISAEKITHKFYISQSYLSRLFKQYSGKTFSEYLTGIRISRACELLKTTDKKTFEIAETVGFKDACYFSITFKKVAGVSPSQYRQKF